MQHLNHGGIGMKSIDTEPETTWLIVMSNLVSDMDNVTLIRILDEVKIHLSDDKCMLHVSKDSPRTLILIVHCPLSQNIATTAATVKEEGRPSLHHTETYLRETFGYRNVMIGKNDVTRHHRLPLKHIVLDEHYYGKVITTTKKKINIGTSSSYKATDVQEQVVWNLGRISTRSNRPIHEYTYNANGSGVDVYTLDTGILANHEEFEGRATLLSNVMVDGIETDCNGHGTHVAGIIGSRTYGVAKNVRIYAVRVLDCTGDGSLADMLAGVDAVLERVARQPQGKPAVINLSLGGNKSPLVDAMIRNLKNAGLVVVIAAGNSGKDACEFSPSGMGLDNYVLVVGASDRRDKRPTWSNSGACVSITSPGVDITSTWYTSITATATISGTSMASPGVAGVAALILQQNPNLRVNEVNKLILDWSTPHIIGATSNLGGGSSLLYAHIDPNVEPDDLDTMITNSSGSDVTDRMPGLILCLTLTLLWAMYMV